MGLYVSMKPQEPDELSAALRAWKVDPAVPENFGHEVWQRIAARQAERADAFWPRLMSWLNDLFARPAFALPLILVGVGTGFGLAQMKARETNARTWQALEERYAKAVNPLVHQVDHLNHLDQ